MAASQQLLWMVSIHAGSIRWTWTYDTAGGSVLAVAVLHAGIGAMGIFHPGDSRAVVSNGVPDRWLNLVAEVTDAFPLLLIAVRLMIVEGGNRLANRDLLTPKEAALPPQTTSEDRE